MNKFALIICLLAGFAVVAPPTLAARQENGTTQAAVPSDSLSTDTFRWGNTTYVNLAIGETFRFEETEVELLALKNRFNLIRVGSDTLLIAVSFRTPATTLGPMTLFVADNKNISALSSYKQTHGLLRKDALVALAPAGQPLVDPWDFTFPVSFTGGFLWRNNEESYMYSYSGANAASSGEDRFFPGVGIDVVNGRGLEKFAVLAMEAGKVIWVETRIPGTAEPKAALCLESASSAGIYYIYQNLFNRDLMVTRNQQLQKGDPIGTIWGDGNLENLNLTVVRSETVPTLQTADCNSVNFYPQLLELYYGRQPHNSQFFTKGQILFGKPAGPLGNVRNASAFEDFLGMGWLLGEWNTPGKVEWISVGPMGNVRLPAVLFRGQKAECTNPHQWYDYQINVRNGVYRIRASVGDCLLPTWQKIEFEGVAAGTFTTSRGEFTWTPEKIVRVRDNKLDVRIYLGDKGQMAGLSEIVFQQAAQ